MDKQTLKDTLKEMFRDKEIEITVDKTENHSFKYSVVTITIDNEVVSETKHRLEYIGL